MNRRYRGLSAGVALSLLGALAAVAATEEGVGAATLALSGAHTPTSALDESGAGYVPWVEMKGGEVIVVWRALGGAR